MTHSARAELNNAVQRHHSTAVGAEKQKIIDVFIAVTGYHETLATCDVSPNQLLPNATARAIAP